MGKHSALKSRKERIMKDQTGPSPEVNHATDNSISAAQPASGREQSTEKPRTAETDQKTPEATHQKKRHRRLIMPGVALLVAVVVAVYYFIFIAPYESTDDAFIEAHVVPVASQVAGRVERLLVDDNQEVKNGDTLVKIDPRDYQAALDQAQAALKTAEGRLEQASAQFKVDQAKVTEEKANVIAAQADAWRAGADNERYQTVGALATSKSQMDYADAKAQSTVAQVDSSQAREKAAEAQVGLDKATIQTEEADIQQREANVREAELNLSYTEVKAAEDGYITHRTVEKGMYIEPGQALLALVPKRVWVVANFKETQLTHMRPEQPVDVHVDAYPQFKIHGHVDSIQAGSGTFFSLIPPENASGNYVKVVQRVPVKIVLDDVPESGVVLGPGMSVEPTVRVK
jgi:membrane fusion protein (multidrug efflux system)